MKNIIKWKKTVPTTSKTNPPSNSEAVRVENLEKRFGSFVAVNKISFTVRHGEIFGFLGPNGAGKSTTIRMLCGIIMPTSGSGHVAGCDIITQSEAIKQSIGYMSQKFSLYEDMTPFENIRFYLGIYNVAEDQWKERTEWVLEMAQLKDFRHRLTRELPQGWRQRLALGCAMHRFFIKKVLAFLYRRIYKTSSLMKAFRLTCQNRMIAGKKLFNNWLCRTIIKRIL